VNSFENADPAPRGLLFLATFGSADRKAIQNATELQQAIDKAKPSEWPAIIERHRAATSKAIALQSQAAPADTEGMRAQAVSKLRHETSAYAALTDGRRNALFKAGCRLATYVTNNVLSEAELREALHEAAVANGAIEKHGEAWFEGCIIGSLDKGKDDQLPPLGRRFRTKTKARRSDSSQEAEVAAPCVGEGSSGAKKHDSAKSAPRVLDISQADRLIAFSNDLELFRTPDGQAYADIQVGDHRETWPIRSSRFRDFLRRAYYKKYRSAPNGNALGSALDTIEARARFEGEQREVFLRVARWEDRVYVDLCNDPWQAVEIDRDGWRTVDEPPVRFRRRPGMLALPTPQVGGSVNLLRQFLNLKSDEDFTLAVAWQLGALVPNGPCPIIAFAGEQGSAKSSASMFLLSLVDPNDTPLRSLPRDDRDLYVAVSNSHVLSFDNMSSLSAPMADSICRISTGGGFATRKLYSDDEEIRFNGRRPIIINGIEELTTRPDLADRAMMLTLEPIPSERRKLERELWSSFREVAPLILGALMTAIARGLRRLPDTTVPNLPRMADFALWATACEEEPGAFMRAYEANRAHATALIVEEDPVAHAVRDLAVFQETPFRGTSTELLALLESQMSERNRRNKNWPTSARGLSGRLRRVAPGLRSAGTRIEFDQRDGQKTRVIVIEHEGATTGQAQLPIGEARNFASEPSGPREAGVDQRVRVERSEAQASELPSDRKGISASSNGRARRPSAPKSLKNKRSLRSNGRDAKIPSSAPDESDDQVF
jgi:hypothetical protein